MGNAAGPQAKAAPILLGKILPGSKAAWICLTQDFGSYND